MFPDSQKIKTHSNSNSNGYDVVAVIDVAVVVIGVVVDAGVVDQGFFNQHSRGGQKAFQVSQLFFLLYLLRSIFAI